MTGCDSVPTMHGIGKAKGLKALKGTPLKLIGKKSSAMEDVVSEGLKFVASCYGRKDTNSSKNRQAIWMMRTDEKPSSIEKYPTKKRSP